MFEDPGEASHPHEEPGVLKFLLSFLYNVLFSSGCSCLFKKKKEARPQGRGIMKREKVLYFMK